MKKRNIEENIFKILMLFSTLSIIFLVLFIIISILIKGLPAMSWQMIIETPKGGYYFGKEGGILNAIIGSIYLSLGSTFLSLIIGLPVALYINIYLVKNFKIVSYIRFFLDLLCGTPSIVYGSFGFMIMIFFGLRTSLLSGIITVTILILPIMIRAMDEIFKSVPQGLTESAYSLGFTKSEIAYKIFKKQCFSGIIMAVILSFGRAIGDTAAVLFTAGYTDNIPTSVFQPVATLPLSIFFQLGSPIPEVRSRAYASAVILTGIILLVSIVARNLAKKYHKNKIKF
jgi:phosphate transport system permease protein